VDADLTFWVASQEWHLKIVESIACDFFVSRLNLTGHKTMTLSTKSNSAIVSYSSLSVFAGPFVSIHAVARAAPSKFIQE